MDYVTIEIVFRASMLSLLIYIDVLESSEMGCMSYMYMSSCHTKGYDSLER